MRRRRPNPAVFLGAMVAIFVAVWSARENRENTPQPHAPETRVARQNDEQTAIRETLALIERGGPFPYEKDGTVFSNRENRLPKKPRGYYREYTVPTPGASNRGARRIVRGQAGETYYTNDHYRTFKRIDNDGHASSDD